MSSWVCTIDRIVVDVREPVPCLSTLGGGGEGIRLHETPQLRVIPARVVEVDIPFLHLPGIAVIRWAYALGISGRAPGMVKGLTYQVSIPIRNRAHAPQLIPIDAAHNAILLHRDALPKVPTFQLYLKATVEINNNKICYQLNIKCFSSY